MQTSNFPDELNAAQVRELTREYIDRVSHYARLFKIVANVLKRFDGKDINKRFLTALQKELGENYNVSFYDVGYSHRTIQIWGNGIESSLSYDIFIGYFGQSFGNNEHPFTTEFNYEVWEKRETNRVLGYEKTVKEAEEAFKNIDSIVKNYNEALSNLNKAYSLLNHLVYQE